MSEQTVDSARFGAAVGAALGAGPGRGTLNSQRLEVLALADQLRSGHLRRGRHAAWLPWSATAIAAAAALVLWLSFGRSSAPAPLVATLRGGELSQRAELPTSATESQALQFSDGSEVVFAPEARASLRGVSHERADLRLNQGRLDASIRKGTGTTWTIGVGPYSVRVVGTRFSVGWDQSAQHLVVEVSEGRVRVFGGDLGATGVSLDPGARLERSYHDASAQTAPSVAEPVARPAETASATEPEALEPVLPSTPLSPSKPSDAVSPPAPATWLTAAAKGKYRDALELAEKQGFDKLSVSLSENDLLTLANSARFCGNGARARQALLKLRQRFAGRPAAELGALYLARVAEDLEKRPTEAIRWLRTFLQEAPSGDLAAGARVNLMSLLLSAGDTRGATDVARDYLRYHPTGPHASKARSLVSAAGR